MKIIKLQSENFKRLVAVEITPAGNMVEITGKNGQGKTSVLDSIWVALAGLEGAPRQPIRKGELESRIILTLGSDKPELVVTRTFRPGKNSDITSKLTVESAEGARFPSPQAVLDKLLGAMSFDPLAFDRMSAKEQFGTLRALVPGVDFAAIDAANKADYDQRTATNRKAKEARAAAANIVVDPLLADGEIIGEAGLTERLEEAGKHNTDIETRKANRQRMQYDANEMKKAAVRNREQAATLRAQADELDKNATTGLASAATIEQKIDAAGPLAEPIDTKALVGEITVARQKNELVQKHKALKVQRRMLLEEATKAEAQADAISEAMDMREAGKRDAIAKANLPVAGIAFGEGEILLGGVPWNQASDAERLTASISMAMAMNPTLRIIRVRDGSLLDEDAMKLLAEMAAKNDSQIWIERVDSSGRVGVVLEDGRIKPTIEEPQA